MGQNGSGIGAAGRGRPVFRGRGGGGAEFGGGRVAQIALVYLLIGRKNMLSSPAKRGKLKIFLPCLYTRRGAAINSGPPRVYYKILIESYKILWRFCEMQKLPDISGFKCVF